MTGYQARGDAVLLEPVIAAGCPIPYRRPQMFGNQSNVRLWALLEEILNFLHFFSGRWKPTLRNDWPY